MMPPVSHTATHCTSRLGCSVQCSVRYHPGCTTNKLRSKSRCFFHTQRSLSTTKQAWNLWYFKRLVSLVYHTVILSYKQSSLQFSGYCLFFFFPFRTNGWWSYTICDTRCLFTRNIKGRYFPTHSMNWTSFCAQSSQPWSGQPSAQKRFLTSASPAPPRLPSSLVFLLLLTPLQPVSSNKAFSLGPHQYCTR